MLFQSLLDKERIQFQSKLVTDIARLCSNRAWKLSVAESMTGGLLSYLLRRYPGSSDYFVGGVVCYDARIKIKLCGVLPKTIKEYGVVSACVAKEMALGSKRIMNTDLSLAITGVAGPANQDFELPPVGTVFIGVSGHQLKYDRVKRVCLEGDRQNVTEEAATVALVFLRDYLQLIGEEKNG